MSASKLKNLILLILLLVNLFLLALVVPKYTADRQRQQQADKSLVALFADAGVALSLEDIPESLPLTMQELTADEDYPLSAVQTVLGGGVLSRPRENGTEYSSALGLALVLGDGEFSATLHYEETADPRTQVESLLETMAIPYVKLTQTQEENGTEIFTAQLTCRQVPLLSHHLSFYYENRSLTRISGFLTPASDPVPIGADRCISARDALVAFLGSRLDIGWMGSRIQSVTQGYALSPDLNRAVWSMRPVWEISTDAGTYFVDGLTQSVSGIS